MKHRRSYIIIILLLRSSRTNTGRGGSPATDTVECSIHIAARATPPARPSKSALRFGKSTPFLLFFSPHVRATRRPHLGAPHTHSPRPRPRRRAAPLRPCAAAVALDPPLPPPASTVGGRPRKRCVSYRSPFCPPIASGSWGNLRWLFRLVVPCHLLLLLLPMMMLLLPSSSSSCCCRCPGGQFHGAPPRVMAPRRGVTRGTVCSITRVFLVPRVFFCYQRDI